MMLSLADFVLWQLNNRFMRHTSMVLNNLIESLDGKNALSLTEEERQARADLVASLITGIAAGAGLDASGANTAAKIETENNAIWVPIIGAILLADKAWTAYELWQDANDINEGRKTIEDVALEKGEEYVIGLIFSGVAKHGWKIGKGVLRNITKESIKASDEYTTVIGRTKDLQNLVKGEKSLLDRLPNQGSPKANWAQNSGVLRQEMSKGMPIRDASPGDNQRLFLNAERYLLKSKGWKFNESTGYWMPPKK